jgi:hypothetical protein
LRPGSSGCWSKGIARPCWATGPRIVDLLRFVGNGLKPTPLAIIAAASENQQYDDYDQNCPRVHDNLLWTREPAVTARRRVARIDGAPRGAAAPSVPMGIRSVTLPAFTFPSPQRSSCNIIPGAVPDCAWWRWRGGVPQSHCRSMRWLP